MKTLLVFSLLFISDTLFSQSNYKIISLITHYYQSGQYSLDKSVDTLRYDGDIEVIEFKGKWYTTYSRHRRFIQSIYPLTNEVLLVELVDEYNNHMIILSMKDKTK